MSDLMLGAAGERVAGEAVAPLIELRDVFCVHRTNEGDAAALGGTTLSIAPGELVCVLGPSGAGKSTLLRVIAGLQIPSAGDVRVLGRDIGRLPARVRARFRHDKIGFLGQRSEAALSPDLTVRDSLSLPLALRGASREARATRVSLLLAATALSDRADALTGELSGGERQRLELCMALAHQPALLLADEPTGELDETSARSVRELIAALTRSHGATAIIASHDPQTALVADRTLRIRDGRVVEDRVGGEEALAVGRGGWVRLAPELLAEVGIGDRARVRTTAGAVILTPAGDGARVAGPRVPEADSVAPGGGRWLPAGIELRSLSRGYGQGNRRRVVIDRLSRSIGPGGMTVVSGRSGSGKTTLLRLLAGLDSPDSGELLIDGREIAGLDEEELAALRRERIGYLPQEPWPIGFLNAEENVVLALRLRGLQDEDAARRAAVVLARVGLADRARQRVSRLSAGEVQRVALARALASARGLLIVDEPTSRLDESHSAAVAELLLGAAERDGQTVICATHDEQVIRRADELVSLASS